MGGAAGDGAVGEVDGDGAAAEGVERVEAGDDGVGAVGCFEPRNPAGDAVEDGGEEGFAILRRAGLEEQRGGGEDGSDGKRLGRGVDVDADAGDDRGRRAFAEQSGALAVADEDVVRPLEAGGESGLGANGLGDGDAAGEGREGEALERKAGAKDDGEVERDAGRGGPGVARAAAAGGRFVAVGTEDLFR